MKKEGSQESKEKQSQLELKRVKLSNQRLSSGLKTRERSGIRMKRMMMGLKEKMNGIGREGIRLTISGFREGPEWVENSDGGGNTGQK